MGDEQATPADGPAGDEFLTGDTPFALVLTDPNQHDNPIVFVSDAFLRVTGYDREETIGRNCRFLQGPLTNQAQVDLIRAGMAERRETQVTLVNYRKDGTPFRNRLLIGPLYDSVGELRYFVGVQHDETDSALPEKMRSDALLSEIQHRVKNHLAMIVGLIRMQIGHSGADELDRLARRVEALQLLYDEMSVSGAPDTSNSLIDLAPYLERIAAAISQIDGRTHVRITTRGDSVSVAPDVAARIGLVVSETLTNAMRHAFDPGSDGRVEARLTSDGPERLRIEIRDNGRGLPDGLDWPMSGGLGAQIVCMILRGLKGTVVVEPSGPGTTIVYDIPIESPP